jgi:hypothetical protein
MRRYLVTFTFLTKGEQRTWAPSIADIQGGFWVNRDLVFTKGSTAKYWIPAAALVMVEAVGDV